MRELLGKGIVSKECLEIVHLDSSAKKSKHIKLRISKSEKRERKRLRKMKYGDYLQTEHWKNLRQQIREKYHESCVLCGSTKELRVHHRSYKHRGNPKKELFDLVLLCDECHFLFHEYQKNRL